MNKKRSTYPASVMTPIPVRRMGFYEKYVKRILDILISLSVIVLLSPVIAVVALLVRVKLGSPVLFTQDRPGLVGADGRENIFRMNKFRTMTDARDEQGNLLPDEVRLTNFGRWLRSTSLDELPELFNILRGTMTLVGPRPQLVRDMTFMTDVQRARHTARPGLTGLAQVNGRNAITWEEKLDWDLRYIEKVTFMGDLKIVFDTVRTALIGREGIVEENMATARDMGDYLLDEGKVTKEEYDKCQAKAKVILSGAKHE